MKKFLAALLALALILTVTTATLADGIGFAAYENRGGECEETYEYTGKVAACKVDADGHCGAGEILIVKPDGTTVTGNGVTLTAGAKYETMELQGKLRLGYEDFNTNVGGNVAIVEAGANAGATVGIGSDGKLTANAQAGAEANLIEVNGKLAANVGGVEFGVTGGVKVGIGAKAKVGYEGGKLHLEVGAALGIGGSVAIDVDVGAIAKKATNLVKNIWKALW